MAASSLLALVNLLDESNKFNQLNEMQSHMSKKITEQRGDLQAANKEESVRINRDKKKFSQFEQYNFIFKLIKRQNNDNTKRSKETKKYDDSSSDSEDNEGQNLTKQKKYNESSSDSDNDKKPLNLFLMGMVIGRMLINTRLEMG